MPRKLNATEMAILGVILERTSPTAVQHAMELWPFFGATLPKRTSGLCPVCRHYGSDCTGPHEVPTYKLPTLAIILEGGLVQDAVSDQPGIANFLEDLLVIDYDTEGSTDLSWVKQADGTWSDACVQSMAVGKATIGLDDISETDPEEE